MTNLDADDLLDRFGLITEEKVAALLGIGIKTLKNRARSELPEYVKSGRRRLFKEASVREMLGIEDRPLVLERRTPSKHDATGYAPRGMSREEAARYISVHGSTFDVLAQQSHMPKPIQLGRHAVWDRITIDSAFSPL